MKKHTSSHQRHRLPSEIISHAIWLYHRFCLSVREVEEVLAKRGITVTDETISSCRLCTIEFYGRRCSKFGRTWCAHEKHSKAPSICPYVATLTIPKIRILTWASLLSP